MDISLLLLFSILTSALILIIFFLYYRNLTSEKTDLEERNKRLAALRKLDEIMMSSSTNLIEVAQGVTDAISVELGFQTGVLAIIDEEKQVLRRIAMSQTPEGKRAISLLPIQYQSLEIPLNATNNLGVQALQQNRPMVTNDLYSVFVPALSRELAQKIQGTGGIKTAFIYPINAKKKKIGIMIFSSANELSRISDYDKETMQALVGVVGITLDNALLYQNLEQTTRQLALANKRLQELDQLKDDFVSVASHELRTPMTAIRSYAWMALNRADESLTPKMQKYISRVLISTERLINLVNDMLNISRIESGRVEITPRAFPMAELAREVYNEVGPKAAEKSLHLQILQTDIPQVFADADKVHQVLLNLVGNALKFTPNNGTITISFFTDGKVLETWVKDSGVGISKEEISHLFKKFGRLDSSYVAAATSGGTGLGLYICKSLIEIMKGRIWAESEGMGKGTTFKFSLPIATPEVLKNAQQYANKVEGGAKTLEPVSI